MTSLADALRAYGVGAEQIKLLNTDEADPNVQIEYQDLLSGDHEVHLDAVVEYDNQPMMYVLRRTSLTLIDDVARERRLAQLLARLACRGGATYLAVVDAGVLTVYPCVLPKGDALPQPLEIVHSSDAAPALFQNLVQGAGGGLGNLKLKPNEVHEVLLRALSGVSARLVKSVALQHLSEAERLHDVLALTGRTLFVRFLADRGILDARTFPLLAAVPADELLSTPERAAQTFEWLDRTFNGELLPIADAAQGYEEYWRRLSTRDPQVLPTLSRIMHHTSDDQTPLWNYIHFAHVPVGLLSEVYEDFTHRHFPTSSKDESVHYTPRHIAEAVVNQAFSGLAAPNEARVLDPAVGAGVFLVVAFKKLVLAHWKKSGVRPDTRAIRAILYKQLRGLDINRPALILGALSLYLTAIEVDADPHPPEKLKFERNLLGSVLFDVSDASGPMYGSLGPNGDAHVGFADLVVGNPPWTEWKRHRDAMRRAADAVANRVIKSRTQHRSDGKLPYSNPDNAPDLPFVWRSMEFCRPNGLLALLLHGRLLFSQRGPTVEARQLVFRHLRVLGILNATLLVDSDLVWPNMRAPFFMLFALNRPMARGETFQFVTPYEEPELHRQGRIRVDPAQVQHLSPEMIEETPTLLKTLTRGTTLDTGVLERIKHLRDLKGNRRVTPLGQYWDERGLQRGQGFQSKRPGHAGEGTEALLALRGVELHSSPERRFGLDQLGLLPFERRELHRPRNPGIYRTPLIVVREGPGDGRDEPKARLALGPRSILYNRSFNGFSAQGHPHAEHLAKYVFVVMNSRLPLYFQLMTSSKLGVERRVVYVEDFNAFPLVHFETLADGDVAEAIRLADALYEHDHADWEELDAFVYRLYGLGSDEQQIVRDTVRMMAPWDSAKQAATALPTPDAIEAFRLQLESSVNAMLRAAGERALITTVATPSGQDAWRFLEVSTSFERAPTSTNSNDLLLKVTQALADVEGSTVLLIPLVPGRLMVGLLAQARYWTTSRAQLLMHKVLQHFDAQHSREARPIL